MDRAQFCYSKGREMRTNENVDMAILCLNKAKELNSKQRDKVLEASILEEFSFCREMKGEYEEAIKVAKECIAAFQQVPGKLGQSGYGNGLNHIGLLMTNLGKYDEGMEYFEKAVKVLEKNKDTKLLVITYGNMGEALKRRGQHKRGIKICRKALELLEMCCENEFEKAIHLHNIGDAYYLMGEVQLSMQYCEQSARLFTEAGNKYGEAMSYGVLGNDYNALGKMDKAISCFERCIKINLELHRDDALAISSGNLALVYERIASAYLAFLRAEEVYESSERCIHYLKLSIKSSDKILKDLTTDTNQTAFAERFYRWHKIIASPFIMSGRSKAALLFLDLGRAKILRQLVYNKWKIKVEDSSESSIESSWTAIEDGKEDERIIDLTRAIEMSDSNATVLFYNFSEQKHILTIWVLDVCGCLYLKTSSISSSQGLEACINKLLEKADVRVPRGYSFLELSTAVNFENGNANKFTSSEFRAPGTMKPQEEKSSKDLTSDTHFHLYRALIDPVKSLIKGTKLIIVPEGCIFFAPFSSFVDENGSLLSEKYHIQVIPSIHVLASSMQTTASKRIGSSLFIGNPKVDHLENLPSAKEEVQYLASLFHAKPLSGCIATKSRVMNLMSDASIIHFAAHGEEGTGSIFLASEPSKGSSSCRLSQSDVLECKVSARLVVLSCCNSGHGKLSSEGVLGIARSFLGAGASAVLVTLWNIHDDFTKEFMKVFYEKILEEKRACLALKETMNKFQKGHQYNSFLFWASFEILGEDVRFTKDEIEEIRRKNRE